MDNQTTLELENFITINVSANKMMAYMSVIRPSWNMKITVADLKEVLAKKNVKYGILENILKEIADGKRYNSYTKIAEGMQKEDGKDGKFTYYFNTKPVSKPKQCEDGSVDFRNLGIVQNVLKGQKLVTYEPPIQGIDGCNVSGEIIKAYNGKSFPLPKGKNVIESEDGLELFADVDGSVEMVAGRVCVSEVFVIHGDVDTGTGDVFFRGDIIVDGNVLTGFKVEATGSIMVEGYVEAATLKAGANVLLKNGIQGSGKGKIFAGGDVTAKFIEMTEVFAGGDICTNAVMRSHIESERDVIISGSRGFIIGGVTKALNRVKATGIGNMAEIATIVNVGFSEEDVRRLVVVDMEIDRLQKELKLIEIKMNNRNPNVDRISLMRTKIEKSAEYNALVKEKKQLASKKEKVGICRIDVENIVNTGVILNIKQDSLKVKSAVRSASFMHGKDQKILALSYRSN